MAGGAVAAARTPGRGPGTGRHTGRAGSRFSGAGRARGQFPGRISSWTRSGCPCRSRCSSRPPRCRGQHRLPGEREVLAVQFGGGPAGGTGLTLETVAKPEVLGVQGDGGAHTVQGERAADAPAASTAVDEALVVELEGRVAPDVEEVTGAQVVVAHLDVRVDRRGVDDDVHGGVLHAVGDPDGTGEGVEPAVDAGHAGMTCRETDLGVRRFDAPVARVGKLRRRVHLEGHVADARVTALGDCDRAVERGETLGRHSESVVTRRNGGDNTPEGVRLPADGLAARAVGDDELCFAHWFVDRVEHPAAEQTGRARDCESGDGAAECAAGLRLVAQPTAELARVLPRAVLTSDP